MDKLSKLGLKYGTDKIGKHNYLPVYYELFKNKRKDIKKILEIGVGEGLGLKMFRDFFPNAIIYGADNIQSRVFVDPPIQVFHCDQSNSHDIQRLLDKTGIDLDIVIDDGSHKPEDQVFTCNEILPKLKDGAYYIIEDVADRGIFLKLPQSKYAEIKEVGKRYDDCLIICQK